ncbi:YgjV family protein [Hyphobacterium sp. SN044]|uniref:YgjV family protein n=1 Tax=Hyphobacterium sp. SN044 TaxID=2912575 RepID=UPI001F1CE6B3|nr:YgjV family protein [Hyphobacterium sp. SN044]MCF8879698.1 YgjV family protein [Hyphobacterium sp. SN044]
MDGFPVTEALIQGLGLAGFGLIIASTRARTKRGFLMRDAAGVALVAAHYFALGEPAGAGYSLFYGSLDIAALYGWHRRFRWLVWVALAAGGHSAVAAGGTALAILARFARGIARTLALVALSTTLWGVYGVLTGSWPQIAFSLVYGAVAVWRAARLYGRARRWRRRRPLP